jgi:glycosyltransferase involved in cell wall biosynthesis
MNKVFLCGNPHTNWKPAMLPRIMQGFWENDYLIADDPNESEFIYCNDCDGYKQFLELADLYPNKVKIVNILDLPDFLPDFPEILERYKKVIDKADIVTSISEFVSGQIKKYYNIDSPVIYQPSKNVKVSEVTLQESNNKLKFLYVGRAGSVNKRFDLVKELMEKYYSEEQLLVVGTEDIGYGKFAGALDDKWLNIFYNSCDFVLSPSSFEGLNLVSIESILAKKPVILCNNCEASLEFLPEFCADANVDSMQEKILDIQNNKSSYDQIIENYNKKYSKQFSSEQVVNNIIKIYNDNIEKI